MHTNSRRPLRTRGMRKATKKKILYIYFAAPCGLAEFPVGGSQCPGTSGTNSYRDKEAAGTPPPPPPRSTKAPSDRLIHRKCAGTHARYLRGAQKEYRFAAPTLSQNLPDPARRRSKLAFGWDAWRLILRKGE